MHQFHLDAIETDATDARVTLNGNRQTQTRISPIAIVRST